jgi:HlyD family secretion protein
VSRWLLGIMAVACTACDGPDQHVHAYGTLERDRLALVADSNEPIVEIVVAEGDLVWAGDVLAVQDDRRANARLAVARAEADAAAAELAEADQGPRAQDIAQARARLAALTSAEQTARLERDRVASLVDRQFVSRQQLDLADGRLEEASARVEEARAALDELLEGTRSEAIDRARSRFAAAEAGLLDIQIAIERTRIQAPVAGTVDALPLEVGERPAQGGTIVVVLAAAPVYARVHVPEPLRARLAPGAAATIRVDGLEPLAGRLRWISADAAFTPYYALNPHDRSRLAYLAEVDVIAPIEGLPTGVPAEVRFDGID